jgi:hypothetical protein
MPEADLRNAGADWLAENCAAISVIAAQAMNGHITLAVEEIEPGAPRN